VLGFGVSSVESLNHNLIAITPPRPRKVIPHLEI
jgi:hypothetical protein